MTVQAPFEAGAVPQPVPAWSAVFALTLCVTTLIASEFMPVSLLTPIATDLHITEGQAGQAIAVSGICAVMASLFIAPVTRGVDRRQVLLSLTLLMMISGLVVAFAPSPAVFMAGRALIGIVIGGFWSMSAATAMRLVPQARVPRALAVFNSGNALATTVAAPLGSFLGQYIGWRGAFFSVVPIAALALVWQLVTLPPMPSEDPSRTGSLFGILRKPQIALGMIAVAFFFMGQFALFTYVRPFLETVTRVNVSTLSSLLLIMGVGRTVGDLSHRCHPEDPPLLSSNRDAARDGRHCRRAHRLGRIRAGRGKSARRMGPDRHGRARRVVDLVEQDAASRRRTRRRPHGCRGSIGNHSGRYRGRLRL